MDEKIYDIIIIGAGVTGCAVARELSKYKAKILVLEKNADVGEGTSKANSAIVHAGYDAKEGSLMAKLNVEGNKMFPKLAKDLDIPFIQNGSLAIGINDEEREVINTLYERGLKNGVSDMQIIERDELLKIEPNVSDEAQVALYAKTAGIVCPFSLTIAMAENAYDNGVEFKFEEEVTNIEKVGDIFKVTTKNSCFESKVVINATGVYADKIHNLICSDKMKITPRKGEYMLLDSSVGNYVTKTIFAVPSKMGKGILVAPTVHGNIIVGPTAEDVDDKEGVCTSEGGLKKVALECAKTVKNVPLRKVITSFAGLRAHEDRHEFIIGESKEVKNFVDVAGIESPGLTSSPAVGKMVADIVKDLLSLSKKDNFIETRKGIPKFNKMTFEEKEKIIKEDSRYASIVCRCEVVTEGEIVNAIHRSLGARTLDGVKRRTTQGMGRCQAGFCTMKVLDILSRETGIPVSELTKKGKNSEIVREKL